MAQEISRDCERLRIAIFLNAEKINSLSTARLLRMVLALGNQIMIGGDHEAQQP
jgi:hypothetical protein